MAFLRTPAVLIVSALAWTVTPYSRAINLVHIDSGSVEGIASSEPAVTAFEGIPYAAPPVGNLRWREPQPVAPWTGVLKADHFGPRPMQEKIYSDMIFRDKGPSEDCLYLNVWTPAKTADDKLPVMVWIYGGGFSAGGSSEPRQDGAHLSSRGVIVVSMNYRLGVFGLLAHPELSAESGNGSGNYGLMDQAAALRWVHRNIAAFGGDLGNVTIFGESAGSFSVSALMASPQSKGLIQRAIGESGSITSPTRTGREMLSLKESEQKGIELGKSIGAPTLAALRAMKAQDLLKAAGPKFVMAFDIDGRFFTENPLDTFAAGRQAHIPLLCGWNADEVRVYQTFGNMRPTAKSYADDVRAHHPKEADDILRLYPARTDEEAVRSAGDLASDLFIVAGTWYWAELQRETTPAPVYVYRFDHVIPIASGTVINGKEATSADTGAPHAGEIRYVFHAFGAEPEIAWTSSDEKVSDLLELYWTNFAKTGNPNSSGLPEWPQYGARDSYSVMHIDAQAHSAPIENRDRYLYWTAPEKQ